MKHSINVSGEMFDFVDFYESKLSFCVPNNLHNSLELNFNSAIILKDSQLPFFKSRGWDQDLYVKGKATLIIEGLSFLNVEQHLYEDLNENKPLICNGNQVVLRRKLGSMKKNEKTYLLELLVDWPPSFCVLSFQTNKITLIIDDDDLIKKE